jgi:hypothetical protein
MISSRIAVPAGSRTIDVEGTKVHARLTFQNGKYYAVGADARGKERAGMGSSKDAACNNLRGCLLAVKHAYERQR